jgi:uncharacterized protein YcfJ
MCTMLLAAALAGNASADRGHQHGWAHRAAAGYGKVLHVKPVYRTVEVPVSDEYCTDNDDVVTADNPEKAALVGAVLGGVVGAVAGNQIGRGNGRTLSTVAGTVLGATIGYQAGPGAAEKIPDFQWSQRRCETVERTELREELLEYRVKYRYRGRIYHTWTDHHPGKRIRIGHRAHQTRF